MIKQRSISFTTILDALRSHVRAKGTETVYTFHDARGHSVSITYQDLDARARKIAASLLDCARPGDRALMMYPTGNDFVEAFLGCLYAGIVAVPVYPPRRRRSSDGLLAISKNCDPALLLCMTNARQDVADTFAGSKASLIATDEVSSDDDCSLPKIDSDGLAFLQYTSGSTGRPKGVQITHGNLIANQVSIQTAFQHDENSKVVSWLPIFHDMGLIGSTLQPLFVGFPSVHISSEEFVRNPARWLTTISHEGATTSGAPNFAYDYCVERISDEALSNVDLGGWSIAFNGAEPVRATTMDRFANRFGRYGFRREAFLPCYGMAEATLFITGGRKSEPVPSCRIETGSCFESGAESGENHQDVSQRVVSSGRASRDAEIRIVDVNSQTAVSDSAIGEIWVRGASIATGYWRRPRHSKATFQNELAGDGDGWLRTGDLGFLRDGELYVTGRLKDMLIVRGRNLHAEDMEHAARHCLKHSSSYAIAVFEAATDKETRLIVALEQRANLVAQLAGETFELLAEAFNDKFSVTLDEALFLRRSGIPRTTSGKVQRRKLRNDYMHNSLLWIARWGKSGIIE